MQLKPRAITTMNLRPLAGLAVILIVACAAEAASNDDVVAGLGKCAALTDSTLRLACYDQLAAGATAPVQPALQSPVAAPPKEDAKSWFGLDVGGWFANETPPARQTKPEQFGSEVLPPPLVAPGATPPAKPLDSITATVDDFAFNDSGHFTVFLDNGQIWQQLQGDADRARFSTHGKDQVMIERAVMGSYELSIDGHSHVFKVKRIK